MLIPLLFISLLFNILSNKCIIIKGVALFALIMEAPLIWLKEALTEVMEPQLTLQNIIKDNIDINKPKKLTLEFIKALLC